MVVLATIDRLVHLVAVDAQRQVHVAQLVVEAAAERIAQLAGVVALVRDARHHVAAAEALRVLQRRRRRRPSRQQVDELEHDCRGADVDGQAQDVGAAQVDRDAVVAHDVPVDA